MGALQRLVAQKVYEMRQRMNLKDDEKHDYYLAKEYLGEFEDRSFNSYHLYSWLLDKEGL